MEYCWFFLNIAVSDFHQEKHSYPPGNEDSEGSAFNKKYIDTSYIF